ncbi:3-hydroxyacyl-ACP dehydratase [Chitinophaga nivalis]|uniref:3-hydroxyacyl-ACP dehydratase n=1 Tax=Chitinophaga nivalis TaxID=2991709 RepID=A0ABT3IFU0_9BACT|nr:3-hydroxyacyl-ACP dehydratase [Chitinophaga nivalis]MCW3467527.1 3-hydroxyacyl-ACP dehydratase [Chitinophaga nivalis]MCW3482781.1 3-hydroxyacyl-ACP dehydratase [Chitinophaga nivalis]
MLAGNFYTITTQTQDAGQVTTTIELNAAHPIFEGHFPEQPVVPGVCMMQIITELLRGALQQPVTLQKAGQMKFLNMIDPGKTPLVDVTISFKTEEAGQKVNATLKRDDTTFMKFQGIFK